MSPSPSDPPTTDPHPGVGVGSAPNLPVALSPRVSDVGGVKVHRVLPRARRRTIGAWCFADLFDGDATPAADASAMVTADGAALSPSVDVGPHAEHHLDHTVAVAGAQLWLAQPDATRNGDPRFGHHADLPVVDHGTFRATVIVGAHDTERSPAVVDTPAVAVSVTATDNGSGTFSLDASNEYCIVVLTGEMVVHGEPPWPTDDGVVVAATAGVDLGKGRTHVTLHATVGSTALVLGGPPLGEELVMFWNFVARTRSEAATAAAPWNAGDPRFGAVASPLERIAAPPVPWS